LNDASAPSTPGAYAPVTPRHLTLDVRGMEPPEPLERVLETIGDFRAGDTLRLVIDCEPRPLFRILAQNGYAWRVEPGTESRFEITIGVRDDASPPQR
jgi:uncharacterized protein (DUF2249 family)